jgi:hypothetical protein
MNLARLTALVCVLGEIALADLEESHLITMPAVQLDPPQQARDDRASNAALPLRDRVDDSNPRFICDPEALEQLIGLKGIAERLREARAPREAVLNLPDEELSSVLRRRSDLSDQALPRNLIVAVQAPDFLYEVLSASDVFGRPMRGDRDCHLRPVTLNAKTERAQLGDDVFIIEVHTEQLAHAIS